MPLHIVRDDLANMRVDAVVVPANSALRIGGGAGEAIARIAGLESMQAACDEIGGCPVGRGVVTPAFNFPAKVIVHAVGPVWKGGQSGEADALASCVHESLRLAVEANAATIALPLLATGSFGFPIGKAIDIETRTIQSFLQNHDVDIWLVLFDRNAVRAGRSLFDDIEEYIDDVYVGEHEFKRTAIFAEPALTSSFASITNDEFSTASEVQPKHKPIHRRQKSRDEQKTYEIGFDGASLSAYPDSHSRIQAEEHSIGSFSAQPQAASNLRNLESQLENLDESFAATVLRLIDERGMTDVEVYKRANMSRQLFAKIRKDDCYRPTKKTACALAFALGLNYEDALALLSRAGFALSHSSKFDVIIEYFLINNIHDIFQINEVLFAYDQPILG